MTLTLCYLTTKEFLSNKVKEKKIAILVRKYTMVGGNSYEMGMTSIMVRCLGEDETTLVHTRSTKGSAEVAEVTLVGKHFVINY